MAFWQSEAGVQKEKVRMGMVGGGAGAFIGAIHRMAANLDGEIELVCGAFSHDAERSRTSGMALALPESRCYASYQQMFAKEARLPASQRMQFVAIVTPNHLHYPVACAAIESGFHVLSDKPATFDLAEAQSLATLLNQHDVRYALTHTYTGYPMVKHAQHIVQRGDLGQVTKVVVEYSQGWLASSDDDTSKQAAWRLNPKYAGVSCCVGDIGVHAANLAEYVCGSDISSICADLGSVVEGRQLDDDASILLRFDNRARGVLLSSQISTGDENNLKLRVYGTQASLEWSQLEPNTLWLKHKDSPTQMLRAGMPGLSDNAQRATRTPPGHPEGYIEAFANIYCNFAEQIRHFELGNPSDNQSHDVPGINEALKGMAFIESAVEASQSEQKWHPVKCHSDKTITGEHTHA